MGRNANGDFGTKVTLSGDQAYKDTMKDIANRMRLVKSELTLADAEYKKNDGSVSALTDRYGALQKQYDLEQQKVKAITEQLAKAKTEYGEDSQQVRYWETQLNNATTAVTKTETSLQGATDALDKAQTEQEKETAATKLAEKAKQALTAAVGVTAGALKTGFVAAAKAASAAIAGLATATGVAVKTGFEWTQQAGESVDSLLTLSTQTGVSAENLQKWDYASRFIDTDVSTMTGSMSKMTKQMGEASKGSDTAGAKFKALGVNIYDSNGNLRDSEDVFMDAIDALGGVSNETERDALAMDLFGKSAQELNPLIEAGSDKLRALGDEADNAGLVMGGSALDALGGFDDAMQRFEATGTGLKNTIAGVLVPVFQPFVDTATGAMGQISAALADGLQPGELNSILQTTFTTLKTAIGSVSQTITDAMPMVSQALSGLVGVVITALPGLLNTILPSALGLLQSVLDAIVANVGPLTQLAVSLLTQLAGFLSANVSTLLDAAGQILTGLIDGITAALPQLIPMAITMLASLATALVNAIPEIVTRLPEIVDAIWQGLLAVDWISLGSNLIHGLINGLNAAVASLGELINNVFRGIWQGILSVFGIASPSTEAASAAGFILQGLLDGFTSAVDGVVEAVKAIFGKIWDAIKSIFGFGGGESDESKESKQAGSDIMTGMKEGISGGEEDVKAVAREVATKVLDAIKTELGITEEGGSAAKLKYVGQGVVDGLAQGLDAQSATAFNGPAYNAAHYIAAAFDDQMGIAGYGFSAAGNAATKYQYIGSAICDGIVAGLYAGNNRVTAAARAVALAAYNAAKAALDINSPSGKYRWLAEMSATGFEQGLTSRMAGLRASVATMTDTLLGSGQRSTATAAAGIDYQQLGAAVADAMEERGLGETGLYIDGQKLGETRVADGVGRRLRRRSDAGINGRSARLVIA